MNRSCSTLLLLHFLFLAVPALVACPPDIAAGADASDREYFVIYPGDPPRLFLPARADLPRYDAREIPILPWESYRGKEVSVEFGAAGEHPTALAIAGNTVLQRVTGLADLERRSSVLKEACDALIVATPEQEFLARYAQFKERGIVVVEANQQVIVSPLFSSGEKRVIDEMQIIDHFNRSIDEAIAEFAPDGEIDGVWILHTHVGTGSPLSINDKAMVVGLAQQMQRTRIKIADFHILAIHPHDRGKVIFDYQLTEADLAASKWSPL